MQLGMIGLGRMGANIIRRVMRDGHTSVAFDTNPDTVDQLVSDGAVGAKTLEEFVQKLDKPRVAWVMIPAGITDKVVEQLADLMDEGDIIINGGNSNYREDYDRAIALKQRGIDYLDVGTSGGVWGLERGYCLMIGGDEKAYQHCEPLFASIAPGIGHIERTAGRSGDPAPEEQGYLHCGPAGSGHFVKMVHNGIEYGMMAAYAEGLNVLAKANSGSKEQTHSAEETPLEQPQYYQYDLDLPKVAEVWRRGSVVASWLLDLTAGALHGNPELDGIAGRVSDSGEGRWTIKAAIDEGVPVPVLSASLFARFSSRGEAVYADKLLSAMRQAFGGHIELPTGE
ncbi:MAG TPA: decarboxylating 6-phosphogluconate dehydrogenase [Jatrophihabitans sp.]|jgi:6-phosphogluconate dehydrogenase|uniref:phosphogluconate dehydrogenase (NAD(+)-dependent, decarboxylating) n=1 Tax=Jatrophihabitans sp. TaxID=1932789 RepID=UPI002DFFF6E7|nr:decarboxylating 6-phosphogluconate dehydrogenase [Jatrophihabitans sp.]